MAIRSAEIGIPAAIGVGEILFDKLNYVIIRCINTLQHIEHVGIADPKRQKLDPEHLIIY